MLPQSRLLLEHYVHKLTHLDIVYHTVSNVKGQNKSKERSKI